jgi:two-component system sensor histidine kinase/response regulator
MSASIDPTKLSMKARMRGTWHRLLLCVLLFVMFTAAWHGLVSPIFLAAGAGLLTTAATVALIQLCFGRAPALVQRPQEERELRERLHLATTTAGISIWEHDLVTQEFLDDGSFWKMVAIPPAKIAVPNDAIHVDEKEEVAGSVRRALSDPTCHEILSIRHRTSNPRPEPQYVQTHMRVFRDSAGTAIRVLGVTWDVTKEVVDSQELASKASQERALLERLNVTTKAAGISPWECDFDAREFSWHGPRPAFFGLDDVPLKDYFRAIGDITLPEDRDNLVNASRNAIERCEDHFECRFRVRGIDGDIHHMQSYARIIGNQLAKPHHVVGVTWDVTADVLAHELLEAKADENRQLLDRLNIATESAGIASWDFDLVARRLVSLNNPIKALGHCGDDCGTEEEFLDRVVPEDRAPLAENIREASKNGTDRLKFRHSATALDGSVVHMQSCARLIFDEHRKATRALGVSWDVTEEVTANARLQQQAEQNRLLLARLNIATDSAGISSWEVDLVSNRFLWIENVISPVARNVQENMALETFTQMVVPEDRQVMPDAISSALANKSDRVGFRHRTINSQNQAIVHLQSFARLMMDDHGTPVRLLGVSWDITKEVKASEALRQQTEQLRSVERRLERASLSSSEGHWEAELQSGYLWYSSSFRTLLGYAEGELTTHVDTLEYLVHPEERDGYHRALREHLSSRVAYDIETRLRMASGQYQWFRMRGMAERNGSGDALLMAGSIHDIHQQKLIEDALDLAQRRFERAINGTQDGLWELDIATDDTWWSPRLAQLLGYPKSALANAKFVRSLTHPEDAMKLQLVTRAHYQDNTPFDVELRLKNASGQYRWYRARAAAERDAAGRARRLSGSLQDVTEARAAREELVRATEAAEAASRAKSHFLANVSHEIRTPMNGIIGMTGLLIDTPLDPTQIDYAETIRSSADSLLTVINDILDFSKIEAGKLDLESIELDLRGTVEDLGAMMAFQAASKGLELIIDVHPDTFDRVLGDPQRLRQCLVNLVGNAIKFTKSGEVVVEVFSVGSDEGHVLTRFEVRDTGMGIAPATRATLFHPFVQADSSTTRHFGGTGLGLSIVRRLVEMMGGRVGVVSEVGVGSTFFFTLPLQPVKVATPVPCAFTVSQYRKLLVVDANVTSQRVLSRQLTHSGYEVTTAGSGAGALEQLGAAVESNQAFDMIITEFHLPDMDGAMLGELVVNTPTLARTRLVMLTSPYRHSDAPPRTAAPGFAAYLTKPVRILELLDSVARVLNGEVLRWQADPRSSIARNSLMRAAIEPRFAGRVLLVEDNLVNQKVAVRILERLGCTVEVADNGADGVAAYEKRAFDMVLMDLQMPVMDGMTAARQIRELETLRHTPIIALTANAMRGEKERCEAAGMDGFLAKPIEIARLRDALTKCGLAVAGQSQGASSAADSPNTLENSSPPVDLGKFHEIIEGDAAFARDLVAAFRTSGAALLAEIAAATVDCDRDALAKAVHMLKGACANMHAHTLHSMALRLEADCPTAEASALQQYNGLLRQEFERTMEFLSDPTVVPQPVNVAS